MKRSRPNANGKVPHHKPNTDHRAVSGDTNMKTNRGNQKQKQSTGPEAYYNEYFPYMDEWLNAGEAEEFGMTELHKFNGDPSMVSMI